MKKMASERIFLSFLFQNSKIPVTKQTIRSHIQNAFAL